jgi:hypothetical protein
LDCRRVGYLRGVPVGGLELLWGLEELEAFGGFVEVGELGDVAELDLTLFLELPEVEELLDC